MLNPAPDNRELRQRCETSQRAVDTLKTELDVFLEISGLLATAGARQVFDKVLKEALAITGAESGSLMIVEDRSLRIVASRGLKTEIVKASRPRVGEGIAGRVAEESRPLIVVSGGGPKSIGRRRKIKDALSVPLLARDGVLGVLNVNNSSHERRFGHEELDLLSAFAGQASVALQMLISKEQAESAFLSVIQALAEAIDAKDPYTTGHSHRVDGYASALGNILSLSEFEIRDIGLAARLHDIGKIGISEDVLLKPEQLNAREYDSVQTHAVIGPKILEPVSALRDLIPIIRHHHEKFDGTGYPAGLRGDEIPQGARILTIADAFDAMASGRAYRGVMALEDVLAELRHQRGRQFDPDFLDVFIGAVESGRISIDAAVIVGQEVRRPPMTGDEVATLITQEPQAALDALRLVSDRLVKRLRNIAGNKLADRLSRALGSAAADFGLVPLLRPGAVERPALPRDVSQENCQRYVKAVRDGTKQIIGTRLTDRVLLEVAADLDERERRLMLTIYRRLGIELPRV